MKINDNVSFTYLKGAATAIDANGVLTQDYTTTAEDYSGKVVDVRNIEDQPLAWETIQYGGLTERSQNLVTLELEDGETKAFYDGRMLNRHVTSAASQLELPAGGLTLMAGFLFYIKIKCVTIAKKINTTGKCGTLEKWFSFVNLVQTE